MAIRTITQNEEDGAIQIGNATGFIPGARETVYAQGTIGDGTYGTTSGDHDYYNVFANAGDVITALVYANNFGQRLDPYLTMYDASGFNLTGRNDFDGLDSLVRYTMPTNGFVTILVSAINTLPTDPFDPASGILNSSSSLDRFGNYDIYINVNSVDHSAAVNDFANTITANATDSLINGDDGNDTITGGAGDDVLDGGAGSDTVDGGGGNNTLIWTWDSAGQTDTYSNIGSGGVLELHGGDGGDMVLSGGGSSPFLVMGNNTLNLGPLGNGTIRLFGGDQYNVIDIRATNLNSSFDFELFGGDQNDYIYGRDLGVPSNDLLDGGDGVDRLFGGNGDDILRGGDGEDSVYGDAGNDIFRGDLDADDDRLFGGDGIDTLSFETLTSSVNIDFLNNTATGLETGFDMLDSIENAIGGLVGDMLTPGNGANVIDGGAGIDTLDFSGYAGYIALNMDTNVHSGTLVVGDTFTNIENIIGGSGDDYFAGDGQNNRYEGGAGNDTLQGRLGEDILIGGGGNDRLFGGLGNDLLNGGAGADAYFGGGDFDTVSYGGSNQVAVSLLNNTASSNDAVGDSFSSIESIIGGYGNDYIVGDTANNDLFGALGNDTLFGWTGRDLLYGGEGNDRLFGGGGNDLIYGGAGNDEIFGNGGRDKFYFYDEYGIDTIKDFEDGLDDIILTGVSAITSFTDLQAGHLSFNGSGDAVITDGANILTVVGLTAALIDSGDFSFSL